MYLPKEIINASERLQSIVMDLVQLQHCLYAVLPSADYQWEQHQTPLPLNPQSSWHSPPCHCRQVQQAFQQPPWHLHRYVLGYHSYPVF
jgi:hypothetical protein